jgi:redox-sensitive bicupin YhaK (pirin superfamily)
MRHAPRHLQRAADRYRGGDPAAGIDTRHAFSFAGFYDPDNVRFGPLLACNEERLAPGAGFADHPHRDLEIVSLVLEGELTHEDPATGRATVLRPGDLQRLTAGSGVRHAERNAGAGPLRFLQMWLAPAEPGGAPGYEVVRALGDGVPYPVPGVPAELAVHRLAAGGPVRAVPAAPAAYLHVLAGTVRLGGGDDAAAATAGATLAEGDAARLTDPGPLLLTAAGGGPAAALVWRFRAA